MYSPFYFERIPTVDAGNLVNGDRILFGPVKRPRAAVKPPADSVPVEIVLGDELKLIGCRIDALPTGSQALQLTLGWHGVRPATEDSTAFFHITPSVSNAELVGQLDHAITDHQYPPTVWAAKSGLQSVCIFRLLRPSNLCEHRTQAVFDQKLIVGGDRHKVVLDESGFRAYCEVWIGS